MIFYKAALSGLVAPDKSIHTKAVHFTVVFYNPPVAVQPGKHVGALGHKGIKVPDPLKILNIGFRGWLLRMDKVRKAHGIPYEKDRKAQSGYIVIAFLGIKSHGKASWIPHGICRAAKTDDCGKTDQYFSLLGWILKKICTCILCHGLIRLEIPKGTAALGMDNPLGDALPVEMCHFFHKIYIIKQHGAIISQSHGIGRIINRRAEAGGQCSAFFHKKTPFLHIYTTVKICIKGVFVLMRILHHTYSKRFKNPIPRG